MASTVSQPRPCFCLKTHQQHTSSSSSLFRSSSGRRRPRLLPGTLLLLPLLLLLSLSLWSQQAEAVVHSSFRRLSGREKKEMQKEILSILGLPGRPRPHPPLRPPSSAPLFMLDLYHAMSADGDDEGNEIIGNGAGVVKIRGSDRLAQVNHAALPTLSTHTPPLGTVVSEADTVMSFVNLVEQERDLLQPRPYWKEFRFDLTPLPQGETVTAAEFRIYKTLTMGQRANRTLHISVYEIQRDNRHREPELVLLDMHFSDLGWKDWVLAPTGYSAYYCDGECSYPLGACMNATNHALIQQVVHLLKPDEVPKACCAPTKLSPISVLFYDDNNNVILKKHRNMVVKTCGCL
ncbi:bone morphogenetic protein 8A [Aulostomus maculatus]